MHTKTGELHRSIDRLAEPIQAQYAPITERQFQTMEPMSKADRKGWMRNQPCPCGSKKKFKRCHWARPEELHTNTLKAEA